MTDTLQIDWSDIAEKLKTSFDAMANAAARSSYNSDKKPYCDSMAALADALARVAAEARAAADKENFRISKP